MINKSLCLICSVLPAVWYSSVFTDTVGGGSCLALYTLVTGCNSGTGAVMSHEKDKLANFSLTGCSLFKTKMSCHCSIIQ